MDSEGNFESDADVDEAISKSPVVGKCRECGGKITELEIELGFALSDECTSCVRDGVNCD